MNLLTIVAAAWQTVVCLDACLQVKERQAATKTGHLAVLVAVFASKNAARQIQRLA